MAKVLIRQDTDSFRNLSPDGMTGELRGNVWPVFPVVRLIGWLRQVGGNPVFELSGRQ